MSHAAKSRIPQGALPWAGLALLLSVVLLPLLGPTIRGHDTLLHYYRIPVLNALWDRGIFFSRWAPGLVLGYGYPLFEFYPPLSAYLLTACYWVVGQNGPWAMNLAFAVCLVAAATGSYLLIRSLFGEVSGLFASAVYTLSPHWLYQTFQRGSLSNALALGLFPSALWALMRLAARPTMRRAVWAAMALAAVLLSHLATSALVIPAGAVLALVTGWTQSGTRGGRMCRLVALGAALLGALALTSFSWLPVLGEIHLTRYLAAISGPDEAFGKHFAQLLAWPPAPIVGMSNPPLALTAGLIPLVLGTLGLGLALPVLLRRGEGVADVVRRDAASAVAAGFLACTALALATPVSAPLWARSGLLRNLQYPWRCLDAAVPMLAVCAGYAFRRAKGRSWRTALLTVMALPALWLGALPYIYPPRTTALPARPTLVQASEAQARYGIWGLTSWGEYAPTAVRDWPAAPPFQGIEGAALDQKLLYEGLPSSAVLHSEGGPLHAGLRLDLPQAMQLTFYIHYFPGWQARVDGAPASIGPDDYGRLRVQVPAGQHTLSVFYAETPLRAVADIASLAALALSVGAVLLPRNALAGHRDQDDARFSCSPDPLGVSRSSGRGAVCLALAILALTKGVWLDHTDSPLVRHVQDGAIRGLARPPWGDFGGELALIGYEITPYRGRDDAVRLSLVWQARRAPRDDDRVMLEVRDARGVPVQGEQHTHPGRSVTSRWEAGQLVFDDYDLRLNDAQRPCVYQLFVSVYDPGTDSPLSLRDAPPGSEGMSASPVGTVRLAPKTQPASSAAQEVGTRFGEAIALEAVSVPLTVHSGAPFTYTLMWRSLKPVAEDYTVFVHLLRADGSVAATNDGQPHGGLYPTRYWAPGETVLDKRTWPAPLSAGEYQIEMGLYQLETGQRLRATGLRSEPGDRVILGTLTVDP